jgi:hypothetical protein
MMLAIVQAAAAEDAQLPFSLTLQPAFTIPNAPPLQSYAHAHADVDGLKWLLVSGRHSGLHDFVEPRPDRLVNDYNVSGDNGHLWVVDIAKKQVWRRPLDCLTHIRTDPLRASSCLSCQVDDRLYVIGGYGESPGADTTGNMLTFDTLTVFDVADTIRAVIDDGPITGYVRQTSDPALRVTGGGLLPLGESLYMVFGQRFDGLYSPAIRDSERIFYQQYTRQVRRVTVTDAPMLSVKVESFPNFEIGNPRPNDPTDPYRRRDLNVAPAISPQGKSRIAAYGGVFRPGTFEGFLEPVYIDEIKQFPFEYQGSQFPYDSFSPGVDRAAQQLLSQYDCAYLCLHDGKSGSMFTTFFGGISSLHYDRQTDKLVKDKVVPNPQGGQPFQDGLPFIKTVSLLRVDKSAKTEGFILPDDLPGYLGAEAAMLVDPAVPHYKNGVLRLDQITKPTVVGYIFGGIESSGPYTTGPEKGGNTAIGTIGSDQFIPILLTPKPSKVRRMPAPPADP